MSFKTSGKLYICQLWPIVVQKIWRSINLSVLINSCSKSLQNRMLIKFWRIVFQKTLENCKFISYDQQSNKNSGEPYIYQQYPIVFQKLWRTVYLSAIFNSLSETLKNRVFIRYEDSFKRSGKLYICQSWSMNIQIVRRSEGITIMTNSSSKLLFILKIYLLNLFQKLNDDNLTKRPHSWKIKLYLMLQHEENLYYYAILIIMANANSHFI